MFGLNGVAFFSLLICFGTGYENLIFRMICFGTGFSSVDAILEKYLPEAELAEVRRVMNGWNQGKPVERLELPCALSENAKASDFDLQAFRFGAATEQLRKPRVVKVCYCERVQMT